MKVINIVIDEKTRTLTFLNDKQTFETEYEKAISDSLEIAFKLWSKELKRLEKNMGKIVKEAEKK